MTLSVFINFDQTRGARKTRNEVYQLEGFFHMVATTIMRWQLSEALLRRSGATRDRWVCENWHGGKMCSTNPVCRSGGEVRGKEREGGRKGEREGERERGKEKGREGERERGRERERERERDSRTKEGKTMERERKVNVIFGKVKKQRGRNDEMLITKAPPKIYL